MVSWISSAASRVWADAFAQNELNIRALLGQCAGTLVDCGCGDGRITSDLAAGIGFSKAVGLEIDEETGRQASALGIEVVASDLNESIPLEDGYADAAVANQIIEHLRDTDRFLSEVHRILKPGGLFVLSTENMSSWHNILAAVMGWQPFSITNISALSSGVGNPIALHRGEQGVPVPMQHLRIFAPRALCELGSIHGFETACVMGAGYFPFRGKTACWLSTHDPRHSMFVTVALRKK
jgi:SAM-dependent methyltransferase